MHYIIYMKNIRNLRLKLIIGFVVFMCFIATGLSFLDRQVLSISIIEIREELLFGNTDYGFINTSFLIGYAIMFTLGGILIDKFGSKLGLGLSVVLWTVATFMHGFAITVVHFAFLRFILGLGEGGAFPGVIKAVVEWVPKKNQALAIGFAIGGSAFGADFLFLYVLDPQVSQRNKKCIARHDWRPFLGTLSCAWLLQCVGRILIRHNIKEDRKR